MNTEALYLAGFAFPVENLGPGRRVAMWVEGCSLDCPGCMSPEIFRQRHPVPVQEATRQILRLLTEADGLTISGGEPFQQASTLAEVIRRLRVVRPVEVLVYTGYELEEILAGPPAGRELLRLVDVLIDGRFELSTANTKQWRGSDNQRVHLLTERSRRYAGEAERLFPTPRVLHLQPLDSFRVRIIGIPERGRRIRPMLQVRKVR